MDQVQAAIDVDVSHSVLMVLGRPMVALIGLLIGSPVAAGGAALCAAWREELALKQEAAHVRLEIGRGAFIRRWLDDLWVLYSSTLSEEALLFLKMLMSTNFYGGALLLQRVRDPEAFGFSVQITKAKGVVVRSRMSFIQEKRNKPGPGWRSVRGSFHGGPQFRSTRTEAAVLAGHFARYADMSSENAVDFQLGVTRLIVELAGTGVEPKTLSSAVKKFTGQDKASLRKMRLAAFWTENRRRAFASYYDEAEARTRAETQLRMAMAEAALIPAE